MTYVYIIIYKYIWLTLKGLWSYDGWNQLNYVLEEVKNPEKNLLKAIISSLVLISGFYLLINFFYFSMLGPAGIMASEAGTITYFEFKSQMPQSDFEKI